MRVPPLVVLHGYIVTVLLSLTIVLVITCASATIGFVVGNDNTAANDFDFHATVIDDEDD